jgi:hypothetical protein
MCGATYACTISITTIARTGKGVEIGKSLAKLFGRAFSIAIVSF